LIPWEDCAFVVGEIEDIIKSKEKNNLNAEFLNALQELLDGGEIT